MAKKQSPLCIKGVCIQWVAWSSWGTHYWGPLLNCQQSCGGKKEGANRESYSSGCWEETVCLSVPLMQHWLSNPLTMYYSLVRQLLSGRQEKNCPKHHWLFVTHSERHHQLTVSQESTENCFFSWATGTLNTKTELILTGHVSTCTF